MNNKAKVKQEKRLNKNKTKIWMNVDCEFSFDSITVLTVLQNGRDKGTP